MEMDKSGIRIKEVGLVTGESSKITYVLTITTPKGLRDIECGEKPSDELIKSLIKLSGAYKAVLEEVKTTTTEYKGKDPHTIYIGNADWKHVGLMVDHDRGGL